MVIGQVSSPMRRLLTVALGRTPKFFIVHRHPPFPGNAHIVCMAVAGQFTGQLHLNKDPMLAIVPWVHNVITSSVVSCCGPPHRPDGFMCGWTCPAIH